MSRSSFRRSFRPRSIRRRLGRDLCWLAVWLPLASILAVLASRPGEITRVVDAMVSLGT